MALTTSSSSGTAGWLGGCPPGEVDLDVGCVGQRPVADGGMWMQVDGRVGRALGADQLDRRGTRPDDPTLVASPQRVALHATQRGRPRSVADSAYRDSSMANRSASTGWADLSTPTTRPLVGTARRAPSSVTATRRDEHVGDTNLELDVQTSSAAVTEVAKGLSDLRDALLAMADLAERDAPISALAPHLREARTGAAAVSMVAAMVAQGSGPATSGRA
jgi:hypothetical protein